MNRLWPKLSTSIRPNTSVSPEAAMKTIMPIARPAKVSVSQVELEPTMGQAMRAIAASSSSGRKSKRLCGSASAAAGARPAGGTAGKSLTPKSSMVGGEREAEQLVLQALVLGQRRHVAAVDDAAVVHHRDAVAERLGHGEVLLDQQHRGRGRLQLAQGGDQVLHDRRRQALARLVDQEKAARLDHGAGDRQ